MLVTIEEIKDFLKILPENTQEDSRLANLAVYYSNLVSNYCGVNFVEGIYTERFDGGVSSVFVSTQPIQNVISVTQHCEGMVGYLGNPGPNGSYLYKDGHEHRLYPTNIEIDSRRKGLSGKSIKFRGDSHIDIDASPDFFFEDLDFNIDFRFMLSDANANCVLMTETNANCNWSFYTETGNVHFSGIINDIVAIDLSAPIEKSKKWINIAVDRNENEFKLFIDGNVITNVYTEIAFANSHSSLRIGNSVDMANGLNGWLDEICISMQSLNQANYNVSSHIFSTTENTKLLVHGNELTDFAYKMNEYLWYPESGEIRIDNYIGQGKPQMTLYPIKTFNDYPLAVEVTYGGGYPPSYAPADLKLAILELIRIGYKYTQGTKTASFKDESFSKYEISSNDFPPEVTRVINQYRTYF